LIHAYAQKEIVLMKKFLLIFLVISSTSKAGLIHLDCFNIVIDTDRKIVMGGSPDDDESWQLSITPNYYTAYLPKIKYIKWLKSKGVNFDIQDKEFAFSINRYSLEYLDKNGLKSKCSVINKPSPLI